MHKRYILSLFIFFSVVMASSAQGSKGKYLNQGWSEGTVTTVNNGRFVGYVLYDNFERVIHFQSLDNQDSKSFREKDVTAVVIFDKGLGKPIKLYSLPFQFDDM